MAKKIRLRHPDADKREDGGLYIADNEIDAMQAQAHGYRREDDDAEQVPAAGKPAPAKSDGK